uniref:DNA-directed RNA polymerase n=1 Tax=Rhabditophanes sp. KR3021 TaxID=114890 RepID=A0AC35UI64_9BILA
MPNSNFDPKGAIGILPINNDGSINVNIAGYSNGGFFFNKNIQYDITHGRNQYYISIDMFTETNEYDLSDEEYYLLDQQFEFFIHHNPGPDESSSVEKIIFSSTLTSILQKIIPFSRFNSANDRNERNFFPTQMRDRIISLDSPKQSISQPREVPSDIPKQSKSKSREMPSNISTLDQIDYYDSADRMLEAFDCGSPYHDDFEDKMFSILVSHIANIAEKQFQSQLDDRLRLCIENMKVEARVGDKYINFNNTLVSAEVGNRLDEFGQLDFMKNAIYIGKGKKKRDIKHIKDIPVNPQEIRLSQKMRIMRELASKGENSQLYVVKIKVNRSDLYCQILESSLINLYGLERLTNVIHGLQNYFTRHDAAKSLAYAAIDNIYPNLQDGECQICIMKCSDYPKCTAKKDWYTMQLSNKVLFGCKKYFERKYSVIIEEQPSILLRGNIRIYRMSSGTSIFFRN